MSIKVAVRLRPFNQREKDRNESEPIIDMVNKKTNNEKNKSYNNININKHIKIQIKKKP